MTPLLALSESIAIYGLVIFFIGKDMQSLYVLTALGTIAMIICRPKMEELETPSKLATMWHLDRRARMLIAL